MSPEKERRYFFHCCLRHLPTPWSFSFINIKGRTLCSPDATQPSAQHLHGTSCSPGEFPQHLMLFCNTQKWVKKRGFGGSRCGSHKFMVGQSPFSHARRNAVGLTTLLPGSPSPAQVILEVFISFLQGRAALSSFTRYTLPALHKLLLPTIIQIT